MNLMRKLGEITGWTDDDVCLCFAAASSLLIGILSML